MMASTMTMTTAQGLEENTLKGVHRSRLSWHFNWLHRRRWILVQLVSVPMTAGEPSTDASLARAAHKQAARPCKLAKVLDDFTTSQAIRTRI